MSSFPRGTVLDVHGRPTTSRFGRFYKGGDWDRDGDIQDYWWYNGGQDTSKLLDRSTWKTILSSARYLFANEPTVRGAVLEMACVSFPITAQYKGADKKWGNKIAEPWLWEWKQNKTLGGPVFDNETCARLRLLARVVDGDVARVFTQDDDGLPKVQYIRAHRIGDRDYDGQISRGPYRGKRSFNGVIVDDRGRPIAYQILGDTEDSDQWISASSMGLTYNPTAFDEARGVSELLASIVPFSDIARLHEYEMRAQQMNAQIVFTEDTESGGYDGPEEALSRPAAGTPINLAAAGMTRRVYEKGMHLYYKANSGAGLKSHRGDRPSRDSQAWEDKMVANSIYGAGWDPNFALMFEQPNGALARVMLQKIRRTVRQNQCIEAKAQLAEDIYALSVGIENDMIPPPSDGDIFSWKYQGPAQLTADTGNEERARIDKYDRGALTLAEWIAEMGGDWETHRAQRAAEVVNLAEHAREIAATFPELTFGECMAWLEYRGIAQPKAPAIDPGEEEPPPKPGDPGDEEARRGRLTRR